MRKMYDDILGEKGTSERCPDCNRKMKKVKDYYACPNGCWEYHDGVWKVGIGS
jgi:hypothetical protein